MCLTDTDLHFNLYISCGAHAAILPHSLCHITAELGIALAVVKVTLQVNGSTQFSRLCPSKTILTIKIKSGTND